MQPDTKSQTVRQADRPKSKPKSKPAPLQGAADPNREAKPQTK